MIYVMVEGILKNVEKIDIEIMEQHMAYTKRAIDRGDILLSGLKADQSGGVFVMKASSVEDVDTYLAWEPFHLHGIQDYHYVVFEPHYLRSDTKF